MASEDSESSESSQTSQTNQTNESVERVMSGRSWEEFCDTLKAAGQTILGEGSPDNALDRAEGFRYLARLARAGLETFLEHADPGAPALHRPIHETVKIGADNPDNYYQHATISGQYEYRIRGTRGTIHYLDFATQSAGVASTGDTRQGGHLEGSELAVAPDGSFEIVLSCDERPGNWLRMDPDSEALIVRQTFLDRESEKPAELTIERITAADEPGSLRPAPLSAERLDKGLASAAGLVMGCSSLFSGWAQGFKQNHNNQLPKFDDSVSMGAGGDPNIGYYHSYWELGPEEALLIEVTPPECKSWNFQLDNHWMESLDYRFHRISFNKHTAQYEEDGSVRLVVAHEDPGHANWIETAGHSQGTMCWRWISADEHPQPQTRVVKWSEISS